MRGCSCGDSCLVLHLDNSERAKRLWFSSRMIMFSVTTGRGRWRICLLFQKFALNLQGPWRKASQAGHNCVSAIMWFDFLPCNTIHQRGKVWLECSVLIENATYTNKINLRITLILEMLLKNICISFKCNGRFKNDLLET